ncbi:SARP family transcriptional regulator [Planobispora rosea]|uniref:SARP family transcriptional regulator n=2 Tax=Planobispora rosea TaxID=35762 RepID=A0A8J3RZA4_PLARO|nr:SARP family transcriptional regulator [Planobispora rosea]GIH83969.1 SARP family transcriptional regulator [Planobispora rosea]
MGALDVRDGTQDRTPTAPKHRDLLTVFILNARRPLTVERLRALLWPREGGERSDSLVRGYIGQLRQLIGKDVITTVSGTYTLAIGEDQLDVDRFRRLVASGRRDDLVEALALWRGPVLADVDPDAERWAETGRLREELEELRLLALERRIGLDLDAGRHRETLAELRNLVRRYPLWQRFRGQYMLALYRSGRRVDALAAYSALRDELDDGHAIEPDPGLQLLYHRMLHDDASLHVSAGPPVLLPHDVSHFTDRQDLIDRVIGGQVVVHGPVGVGKSALALHAAWRHRESFPDGILYADMRETASPAAVLEDFLRWLGCPAQAVPATVDQRERLLRTYTANRRLLVLLDNAADEAQVRPLLTACPTVVTSRSALGGLTGATRVPVGVLDDDSAKDLLVKLIGPDRGSDREDVSKLVHICGGLPIALRITGSRLASRPDWTAGYLVGLLEDERNRLDRLNAGDQTLRSVFSIGYDGLPETARRTLRSLGALSAPDVADWVAARLGGGAETLVEAGLLETHVIDVAGQARYRLHHLTRLFARELLDEKSVPDVLSDLFAVAMARVQASRFSLVSGDLRTASATGDIRESVEWLLAERAFLTGLVADLHGAALDDECWRLAHLLTPFLERHRFLDDWRHVSETALDAARRAGNVRGEALILRDQGDLHRAERRWDLAHDRLRLALGIFLREGGGGDLARVRRRLGHVQLELGEVGRALLTLTRCLDSAENPRDAAETLHALGVTLKRGERMDEAADRLAASAELFAGLGDRLRQADALVELAAVQLAQNLTSDARETAETARGIAVRLSDRLLNAHALLALARVNLAEDATDRARDLAGEAQKIFEEVGDDRGRSEALDVLAQA